MNAVALDAVERHALHHKLHSSIRVEEHQGDDASAQLGTVGSGGGEWARWETRGIASGGGVTPGKVKTPCPKRNNRTGAPHPSTQGPVPTNPHTTTLFDHSLGTGIPKARHLNCTQSEPDCPTSTVLGSWDTTHMSSSAAPLAPASCSSQSHRPCPQCVKKAWAPTTRASMGSRSPWGTRGGAPIGM